MPPRRTVSVLCAFLVAFAALSFGVTVEKEDPRFALLPARIWRNPGGVASLDLVYGAGGRGHAPGSAFRFSGRCRLFFFWRKLAA